MQWCWNITSCHAIVRSYRRPYCEQSCQKTLALHCHYYDTLILCFSKLATIQLHPSVVLLRRASVYIVVGYCVVDSGRLEIKVRSSYVVLYAPVCRVKHSTHFCILFVFWPEFSRFVIRSFACCASIFYILFLRYYLAVRK